MGLMPPPPPPDSAAASSGLEPGWRCADCGYLWGEDARIGEHYIISRTDNRPHCVLRPYCRQRQLRRTLNLAGKYHICDERGCWRLVDGREFYGQVPTAHLLAMAEQRPSNGREIGWRGRVSEMMRVWAVLVIHSWCFPVCRTYACRLNSRGDDVEYVQHNVRGKTVVSGDPAPLRVEDIAAALNMWQPNVSRALLALDRRGLIRREDGYIYLADQPREVTIEERRQFGGDEDDTGRDYDRPAIPSDLRALPNDVRWRANDLIKRAPEHLKLNIRALILQPVNRYIESVLPLKQQIADIKNRRNEELEEALRAAAQLVPGDRNGSASAWGYPAAPVPDLGQNDIRDGIAKGPKTAILRDTLLLPRDTSIQAAAQPAADDSSASAAAPAAALTPLPIEPNGSPPAEEHPAPAAMWEAGFGRQALSKLPLYADRPLLMRVHQEIERLGYAPSEQLVTGIWHDCRAALPDIDAEEIAEEIAALASRAQRADNPLGFLRIAVPGNIPQIVQRRAERRAAAAGDQRRAAAAEAQSRRLEAELAAQAAVEAAWERLPAAQKAELQHRAHRELESEPRFRRLTIQAQRAEIEARAKGKLRRELQGKSGADTGEPHGDSGTHHPRKEASP